MLLLGDKLANVYPQGRLISIVNTVNIRILLSLVLITPLVVVIGIYASHKIAGPIYRIEKYLSAMAGGDLSIPLTLRKNDELVSLANGINNVADTMKASIKEEKERLASSMVLLENIKRLARAGSIDRHALEKAVDKVSEDISRLNAELTKYKL
jgi:signal transduction histidine kinase